MVLLSESFYSRPILGGGPPTPFGVQSIKSYVYQLVNRSKERSIKGVVKEYSGEKFYFGKLKTKTICNFIFYPIATNIDASIVGSA